MDIPAWLPLTTPRSIAILERTQVKIIFDFFLEDSQLNVYADQRKVRPPSAPTTEALVAPGHPQEFNSYFEARRRTASLATSSRRLLRSVSPAAADLRTVRAMPSIMSSELYRRAIPTGQRAMCRHHPTVPTPKAAAMRQSSRPLRTTRRPHARRSTECDRVRREGPYQVEEVRRDRQGRLAGSRSGELC